FFIDWIYHNNIPLCKLFLAHYTYSLPFFLIIHRFAHCTLCKRMSTWHKIYAPCTGSKFFLRYWAQKLLFSVLLFTFTSRRPFANFELDLNDILLASNLRSITLLLKQPSKH